MRRRIIVGPILAVGLPRSQSKRSQRNSTSRSPLYVAGSTLTTGLGSGRRGNKNRAITQIALFLTTH
ncbi:MAG TPA: hypothetical protein VKV40_08305 [Ktedonobacteraceae bacterium]|nr:hypothetical protein [Ktedonobacteraceae bacterium]